jgi:Anthranilate synthase component I, N terminal region
LTDGRGGCYSYFTADPFLVIRSRGRRVELTGPAGQVVTEEDPWTSLQLLLRLYAVDRVTGLPELDVGFYDWVLAAAHLSGEGWIVATGLPTGEEVDARARGRRDSRAAVCSSSLVEQRYKPRGPAAAFELPSRRLPSGHRESQGVHRRRRHLSGQPLAPARGRVGWGGLAALRAAARVLSRLVRRLPGPGGCQSS